MVAAATAKLRQPNRVQTWAAI